LEEVGDGGTVENPARELGTKKKKTQIKKTTEGGRDRGGDRIGCARRGVNLQKNEGMSAYEKGGTVVRKEAKMGEKKKK